MKKIYLYILLALTVNLKAQTPAANQGSNNNFSVYGQIGYAYISALDVGGYILPINLADIKLVPPHNNFDNILISAFPNPAYDAITIRLEAEEKINTIDVQLFDLNAKKISVYKQISTINNRAVIKLNLYNLPPATYLLKLQVNNKNLSFKIIKH